MNREENEEIISGFITGEPQWMLDVGVGPGTEWRTLKKAYPDMRLIGFEPDPKWYGKWAAEFRQFGELWPNALWSENRELDLYIDELWSSTLYRCDQRPNLPELCVKAVTLDSVNDFFGGTMRDVLLWLDIEGAELAALKGGWNLFAKRRVKWINVETRERWQPMRQLKGATVRAEVFEFLTHAGFELVHHYNHRPATGRHDEIWILSGD